MLAISLASCFVGFIMGSWYRVEGAVALIPMGGKKGEGKFAKICVGDLRKVEDHSKRWHLDGNGYAQCRSKVTGKSVYMHRVIKDFPENPLEVDHINHDKLDNRRVNLRLVTGSTNNRNRSSFKIKGVGSQYKGVYWYKRAKKWVARIQLPNRKRKYLGRFIHEEDAAKAYDKEFKKLYQEEIESGTKLNF